MTATSNGNGHDDDPPNLDLLIKLLKLTTSNHDHEALLAMRKANQQLQKFGGDWERLLRGRVTVIGDPFANMSAPPPPPPKAAAPAQPSWSTPQAAAAPPPPKKYVPLGPNRYDGHCHNCGTFTGVGKGQIFKRPHTTKWLIHCSPCDQQIQRTDFIRTVAAKRQKASIYDLSDSL